MVEEVKHVSKAADGTVTTIKTTKTVKSQTPKLTTKISTTNRPKSYNKTRMTAKEREELLIENFVGLQKAMTNLSVKFGGLSDNISRLLEVFELSAKTQLEESPKMDDKELLKKIDSLVDQNKTIAKGLVLIDEKISESSNAPEVPERPPMSHEPSRPPMPSHSRNKPLPRI